VIGENQRRVDAYAAGHGYETITDYTSRHQVGWSPEVNDRFISDSMTEGREIVDIGPDFDRRRNEGRGPSSHYGRERMQTKNYDNRTKAFERTGKNTGEIKD